MFVGILSGDGLLYHVRYPIYCMWMWTTENVHCTLCAQFILNRFHSVCNYSFGPASKREGIGQRHSQRNKYKKKKNRRKQQTTTTKIKPTQHRDTVAYKHTEQQS